MSRRPLTPSQILTPVYDGFFERLDTSVAAGWVQPRLPVEGSRGCWWGEKHHCTFCGLNGSFMEFRSKSPDRFHDELVELARRYQVLDFMVVDNILDMGYFDTVLRRLAESDHQLRLHFEVKSNLRRPHFRRLVEAGTVMVQPGIESLSSKVLKLMDKGVTGCLNVRALRDAQSTGVSVCWNYLYGFPGESAADYREIIRQLPMLHHLEPPGGSSRIAIERFSPYFDRPELGFPDLRPPPSTPTSTACPKPRPPTSPTSSPPPRRASAGRSPPSWTRRSRRGTPPIRAAGSATRTWASGSCWSTGGRRTTGRCWS